LLSFLIRLAALQIKGIAAHGWCELEDPDLVPEGLQPISKSPEQDNEAGELDGGDGSGAPSSESWLM
jgi:hypothetical protein